MNKVELFLVLTFLACIIAATSAAWRRDKLAEAWSFAIGSISIGALLAYTGDKLLVPGIVLLCIGFGIALYHWRETAHKIRLAYACGLHRRS